MCVVVKRWMLAIALVVIGTSLFHGTVSAQYHDYRDLLEFSMHWRTTDPEHGPNELLDFIRVFRTPVPTVIVTPTPTPDIPLHPGNHCDEAIELDSMPEWFEASLTDDYTTTAAELVLSCTDLADIFFTFDLSAPGILEGTLAAGCGFDWYQNCEEVQQSFRGLTWASQLFDAGTVIVGLRGNIIPDTVAMELHFAEVTPTATPTPTVPPPGDQCESAIVIESLPAQIEFELTAEYSITAVSSVASCTEFADVFFTFDLPELSLVEGQIALGCGFDWYQNCDGVYEYFRGLTWATQVFEAGPVIVAIRGDISPETLFLSLDVVEVTYTPTPTNTPTFTETPTLTNTPTATMTFLATATPWLDCAGVDLLSATNSSACADQGWVLCGSGPGLMCFNENMATTDLFYAFPFIGSATGVAYRELRVRPGEEYVVEFQQSVGTLGLGSVDFRVAMLDAISNAAPFAACHELIGTGTQVMSSTLYPRTETMRFIPQTSVAYLVFNASGQQLAENHGLWARLYANPEHPEYPGTVNIRQANCVIPTNTPTEIPTATATFTPAPTVSGDIVLELDFEADDGGAIGCTTDTSPEAPIPVRVNINELSNPPQQPPPSGEYVFGTDLSWNSRQEGVVIGFDTEIGTTYTASYWVYTGLALPTSAVISDEPLPVCASPEVLSATTIVGGNNWVQVALPEEYVATTTRSYLNILTQVGSLYPLYLDDIVIYKE